ncbi:helicase C-terminal domain-containing protein [Mesorhizobium sp. B2-4-14]|uniref:helicase C-terminal domain-containing protein n=1 Tax=Mesorhizobium sp. B2-4-14 TaxID=2589935 RepID=UPI0015E429D8|nr:helicase C-terminal domain-containing protein [Mesorhizobium sp. B2-4-14]
MSLAYMQGMLFPRAERATPDLGGDEAEDASDEDADDPLSMSNATLPASMGMSLCVSPGSTIRVTVGAAVYAPIKPGEAFDDHDLGSVSKSSAAESTTDNTDVQPDPASQKKAPKGRGKATGWWQRRQLEASTRDVGVEGLEATLVLEKHASLEVLSRTLANGEILLTLSLSNIHEAKNARSSDDTLYQVSMRAEPVDGQILKYPAARYVPPSDEERELRVIYGEQRPYAVGHGVATDWNLEKGRCEWVKTEALPTAHVWRPVFDNLSVVRDGEQVTFDDDELFKIAPLASGDLSGPELIDRLTRLVEFYEEWIASQSALSVDRNLKDDASRMIGRCERSAARMKQGIGIMERDADIARCFMLANRAMLMSMSHAARASGRGRKDGLQGPFDLGRAETAPIDYFANPAQWRPFQLAFFLLVLPSLAGEELTDRELVDVIWFATGGGKTEAYLFVSAFELFRRRIVDGKSGGGTGVINRYTYRFLTADQFQRTAGVICAMEMIRRELAAAGDTTVGQEEFSIGLFVGGDVSPNSFAGDKDGALTPTQELLDSSQPRDANPFPIESCPSCGTLLVPEERKAKPDGSPDESFYGFLATANSFTTRCPEEDCAFHESLPVYFIDEQLFRAPPSFLLGTIDKFAMIPWKEHGGVLLGVGTGWSSPSLVIQDELHLISGPLGTLAGIYEAAFETLMATAGKPPKVIASTATIRNASVQCRRIYGRPSMVFPSPGLRAEDSFFSKLDTGNKERSRLYAGVMAQGLRSTVAASWTMATLLQSSFELVDEGQLTSNEADAYWTLVAYHNSKRELGRIVNATRDEIPTRMKVYATDVTVERPSNFRILELKAHAETPVPRARQLLARRHRPDQPAIDVVPCTNIISVGVDIDRLGMMMVNGQPKLSAEYIQATSRVGRGAVPGLVVAAYSPSKPRDRSHYESFRDYHERFYSFVEPTSVTPGALPAIERGLHAALVTVVRHGTRLRRNSTARQFDPTEPLVAAVITHLEQRLLKAYDGPTEAEERERISAKLTEKVSEWRGWARSVDGLQYTFASQQQRPHLLVRYGNKKVDGAGWHTLQSMRHVDKEITLEDMGIAQANNP